MAYFPNGTSGLVYQEKYCDNCWNLRDLNDGRGFGCPIWDWHTLKSYEQIESKSKTRVQNMLAGLYYESLEHFIPTKDDGFPAECIMFLPKNQVDVQGQMKMFEENKT